MLLLYLGLFLLAWKTEAACSGRFCSGGSFSPYNMYRIVEGEVASVNMGYFRAHLATNPGSIDRYSYYRCYSSSRVQMAINSITIRQVGNEFDPYMLDNSFTLNYTYLELDSSTNYNLLAVRVGFYEGCVIAIVWNKIMSGTNVGILQVDRTTYRIGRHLNQINDQSTEFHTVNKMCYNYTVPTSSNYDNVRNHYFPSCNTWRYFFHPYKKMFFFIERDSQYNYRKFIATCFPYNTNPTSACDADFNQAGTPTFKINTFMSYSGNRYSFYTAVMDVAFTKSQGYMAFQYRYQSSLTNRRLFIYRMSFSGSSCSDYQLALNTQIFRMDSHNSYVINSIKVIKNVGVAFLRRSVGGIYIIPLTDSGTNALGSVYSYNRIETGVYWRLVQMSVDSVEDPPLFGISSGAIHSIYRVTNVATLIYTNATLDFYNYPIDTGRFHFMVVMPGKCSQTLANADYNYAQIIYISLETLQVDFCIEETPRTSSTSSVDADACGNGVLDYGEECDDGNRRNSDGCKSDCTIEPGWRCYNSPYKTKSQCEQNECGDSYVNEAAPEYEVCDDGNLVSGDGCTVDCRKIEKGWYCGTPGQACIKVCPDSTINDIKGLPHHLYAYKEICDDGNDVDGDGCSSDCMAIEKFYECPTPGQACNLICSNGRLDPAYLDVAAETCDDNNTVSGDGCSSTCQIEFPYKCPTPGQPCYHPCGDDVLDIMAGYAEECDDGNLDSGDGCAANCKLETLPRTYTYTVTTQSLVKEQMVTSSTTIHKVNDCKSPYVPVASGSSYTPKPANYACYTGRHCFECTGPRFPGYPVIKDKFLSDSPYAFLANVNRGRMRAMHYMNEVGISLVVNGKTLIKNSGINLEIQHNSIGAVRLSLGRYYIQSKGTNQIQVYTITNDTAKSPRITLLHESTRSIPPQLGNDFFIWWPGPNLLMSRQFNGRNFDFFSLHNNTPNCLTEASCKTSLWFDGPIIPTLEIAGDILLDPVFRDGRMYLPLFISDMATPANTKYIVAIFESQLPFQFLRIKDVVLPSEIVSIASFPEGVVATVKGTNQFYSIEKGQFCTLSFTSSTVLVDAAVTPAWVLVQDRADPDDPRVHKPVYGYARRYALYSVTYVSSSNTITVDSAYPWNLPNDEPESRHKTGRYNLAYPHDITGKYFVNLAIHPCSDYVLYRWDEWFKMSASIYDLELNVTRCMDILLDDPTFA